MDCSPKLQRQCSPSCMALDVGQWCNTRRFSRRLTDDYYEDDEFDYSSSQSSLGMRWRGLCKRIAKEKRRVLKNSAAPTHVPYDPYTYAQNFDDGSAWIEPENLSRTFSARFAKPSRILLQRGSD